jgi:hypothetical protein
MNHARQAGIIHPGDQTILLRLLGVMFIMGMTLLLFFRLTVTVDEHYLRAVFGIGIVGKRILLTDIAEIRTVTNPWWYGWGIRKIPGGWLWNITGLEAVELKLKNGRMFRIGTDEPETLENILKTRIHILPSA